MDDKTSLNIKVFMPEVPSTNRVCRVFGKSISSLGLYMQFSKGVFCCKDFGWEKKKGK